MHERRPHICPVCARLARAMDIMFTLHAEHEMNCSTAAARHLASSGVDVYTAIAGVAPALHSLHCPLILRPLSICLSNQWLGGYACRFCCDSCGYPGRRRLCKRSAPSVILGQGHRAELAHAVQRLLTQSCLQYGGSIAEGWRMQAWQTRCILRP